MIGRTNAIVMAGGAKIDIVTASSLPAQVINGQLLIVTSNTPSKFTIDTVQPSNPSANDIWVEMGADSNFILLESGKVFLNVRPHRAWQYNNMFVGMDAYLGVNDSWVQVSRTSTIMGVSHDTTKDSSTLTRLEDSIGLSATAGVGTVAQVSDFDNMPIYRDIKLCNLAANGTVNAYLDDAGFKRDGTNGDVMVEIPAFYYKIEADNGIENWYIADLPTEGFEKHPAFRNTGEKIYVSAYEAASGYVSKSGVGVLGEITRATARTGVKNKASKWSQLDVAAVMAVNLLLYIEYASLDGQSAIAPGISKISNASQQNTGFTDSMAGHTGRAAGTADAVAMKYRHIENWWGNTNTWVDGLNYNSNYYYCLDPSKYADGTATNYTQAYTAPTDLSGYVKTMGLNASYPWLRLPTVVGGSSSTYYCDSAYTDSGWRVAVFGGYYSAGLSCGPAFWVLVYDSATAASYIGCRLLYIP